MIFKNFKLVKISFSFKRILSVFVEVQYLVLSKGNKNLWTFIKTSAIENPKTAIQGVQ